MNDKKITSFEKHVNLKSGLKISLMKIINPDVNQLNYCFKNYNFSKNSMCKIFSIDKFFKSLLST